MKNNHIIMVILFALFSWSLGDGASVPMPKKIDIEFDIYDQSRFDCVSCLENYDSQDLGASCCDQLSEFFTCTELESYFNWNCSGCECANDSVFVSNYGCTDSTASNYSPEAEYNNGTCWYPHLTAIGDTNKIILNWNPYSIDENSRERIDITDGCELPDSDLMGYLHLTSDGRVLYKSPDDIGGFQFDAIDAGIIEGYGGDAASAGFLIQSMGSTVLAFSLSGSIIPAGCGTLVNLDLDSDAAGLTNIVISNANALSIYFEYYEGGSPEIEGCMDLVACNYNVEATIDDDSCEYAMENYDCDGSCIANIDCNGECGGTAELDECGVCDGFGVPEGACDCEGNILDCAGVCGGGLMNDCNGECGGTAEIDVCGECGGMETDSNNCVNCTGEFDDCGMCTGGSTGLAYNYAMDCNGICFGPLLYSCIGGEGSTLYECELDGGYWSIDGTDQCGLCGGNGYVDWDCNDGSSSCWDIAEGACDCDGNILDCAGDCGGLAIEDECGVCEGSGMSSCAVDGEMVCKLEDCTIYYNVFRYEQDSEDSGSKIANEIIDISYTDEGLEYINTFNYAVTFIDGWGNESVYSNIASARPVVLPDFSYLPSTIPMAYSFAYISLIDTDSSNIITADDWVGAFSGDTCVGAMQIKDIEMRDCDLGDCALMYIYGDDGSASSNGYLNNGELPAFKIWDGSTNSYYNAVSEADDCTFMNEGYCCSDLLTSDIFGCTDPASCTYDSDATVDDGTCLYNDCFGDCGGGGIIDACDNCHYIDDPDINLEICHPDGANCVDDNQCEADYCDACGECAGNNVDCHPDGADCVDDNQCEADYCDACGECAGNNVDCHPDGAYCVDDNQCEADYCDACGECAGNNVDCHLDGADCVDDNQCEADYCDACGECAGNNVDCLDNWAYCTDDNQCEADYCDPCNDCGGDGPGVYACQEIPSGFEWNQSMHQAFYSVAEVFDNQGNILVHGEDWIGAFVDTICVGSVLWSDEGATIPLMGDDGTSFTEGYINVGEIPTFKMYDASMGAVFDLHVHNFDDPYHNYENINLEFSYFNFVYIDALIPQYSNYNRELDSGVNFVSFYVLPITSFITDVFETVDCSNIFGIVGEGVGAVCHDGDWLGSLYSIQSSDGYNVVVDSNATISFLGYNYNPDQEYYLHAGANFISFPAYGDYALVDVIPNELYVDGNSILGKGEAATFFNGVLYGSLTLLSGGHSYWFMVDSPVHFSFDFNHAVGRVEKSYVQTLPEDNQFSISQSENQAFYFVDNVKLNNGIIEEGDWILTYHGNTPAGIRQWKGELIDVPAMGHSEFDISLNYFDEGDIPIFKLLKQSSGKLITLKGDIPAWSVNGVNKITELSEKNPLPENISLEKVYPNPFNPSTSIYYAIPEDLEVSLNIYNLQGQVVESLVDGNVNAGYHKIVWNADSNSSGVYFLKMIVGEHVTTQKLLLVK